MSIITTIIPIFAVIALGALAKRRHFIPPEFLEPANRLVYYLAIPAMIFRAISQATIAAEFDGWVVGITLACVVLAFALGVAASSFLQVRTFRRGTFIQCSFHGNLGYIGLAVIFYYLGDDGLARGSIIAGMVMILQNFLAVFTLQFYTSQRQQTLNWKLLLGRIVINPVILSALAGMLYSAFGPPLPVIIDRSLKIVSDMALPLALLLIGASLSFSLVRRQFSGVLAASTIKLVATPATALVLFTVFTIPPAIFLPGLIILASPTATLTYVMAKEMNGDPDFAVAAISICTILSAVTYSVWLQLAEFL